MLRRHVPYVHTCGRRQATCLEGNYAVTHDPCQFGSSAGYARCYVIVDRVWFPRFTQETGFRSIGKASFPLILLDQRMFPKSKHQLDLLSRFEHSIIAVNQLQLSFAASRADFPLRRARV
jgi:uncharacterized circularly permuted ATP-grasp superfamily protein